MNSNQIIESLYLTYPGNISNSQFSFSQKIKYFFKTYLITLALIFCVGIIIFIIDFLVKKYFGFSIQSRDSIYKNKINGIFKNVLALSVITPFFEEIIFRLWLNLNTTNIAVSIAVICTRLVYIKVHLLDISHWSVVIQRIAVFIFIFLIVHYLLSKKKFTARLSTKRFLFYLSAIVFGLGHMTNYPFIHSWALFFYPLYTLPQIIMGLTISNIRLKQGFGWGWLLHALINLPTALFI